MTPEAVAALLERWAPVWQRRIVGPELAAWQSHLLRHDQDDVQAVLDALTDAGNYHPLLAHVMGRLNVVEPQRPAPYVPEPEWTGPTDRGRQMLAQARADVQQAFRWENYRNRTDDPEVIDA